MASFAAVKARVAIGRQRHWRATDEGKQPGVGADPGKEPNRSRRRDRAPRRPHREHGDEHSTGQAQKRPRKSAAPHRARGRAGAGRDGPARRVGRALLDLPKLDARLADVAQALLRVALQAALEQGPEPRRRSRGQLRPVGFAHQNRRERVAHGLAGEEPLTCQHLEDDDAKGPDVRTLVDAPAARLLGGHVPRGAEDEPCVGHLARHGRRPGEPAAARRGRVVLPSLCQAEVKDLDGAVRRDLDVGGLQVPVDDAYLVRGFEPFGDLLRDGDRFLDGNRPPAQSSREVLTFDQLHREQMTPGAFFERVKSRDAGVIEACQQLRLAPEAGASFFILEEFFRQHLERHRPVDAGIPRPIHLPHPAGAERRDDFVRSETSSGGQRHEVTGFYSALGRSSPRSSMFRATISEPFVHPRPLDPFGSMRKDGPRRCWPR